MAGVNYNLESSKKLKHKLSDISVAMENEDENGEVDSPDYELYVRVFTDFVHIVNVVNMSIMLDCATSK